MRSSEEFAENSSIESLGASRIKDSKTGNSKRVFSPNYFAEIDVLPTHTIARTLLMHAISDVREKYGTCATVSLILPGTYIFREFPFPRSRGDRYASNSVVRNYLRSHVPGIIYYRRQLTSVVNRRNLNLKIRTRSDMCKFLIDKKVSFSLGKKG